jgi:beta-lactamase class C
MKIAALAICSIVTLSLQTESAFADPTGISRSDDNLARAVAERFDAYFQGQVRGQDIPGAAFAVASPHRVIMTGSAGHTDTSRQRPVDEDTVFRVASVSKTFAAGLTGVLVKEGEFDWNDPVVSYLPHFRVNGDSSQLRVEHLLGQSSGLIPHAYDNLIEDGQDMSRITEQFRKLSYICTPGQCYSYQNSVFSLIEPIIESTTQQEYGELMRRKIFRPLEMNTASVGFEPLVGNPNHARPHVKSGGRWKTVRVKPNYYRVAPAAGVNASALDMGKWLVAQMGGKPAVLDPSVVETLIEPRVKTRSDLRRKYWRDMVTEAHYGLGWRIYRIGDHEIAYHSGWVSGYRADIAWSGKHGIGIAVLMNVEDSTINDLTTTFWQMAFETLAAPEAQGAGSVAALSP